jgi:hypothetical protein
MNEIDLIVKWLQKIGGVVDDAFYYHELYQNTADGAFWYLGQAEGMDINKNFFLGNVEIHTTISGVVVLTNAMIINNDFNTVLKNSLVRGAFIYECGVALDMSLMGSGIYVGNRRLYGCGFNKMATSLTGFGAATFAQDITFNGYAFVMK